MAEVLLFHHAQGLTPGVRAFADDLRAAGHIVHTPDLFDGRTFQSIDEVSPTSVRSDSTTCGARRPRRRRTASRARLRRVLVRRSAGAEARTNTARSPRACSSTLAFPISGEWAFGPWPDGVAVRSTAWTTTRSSLARATSTPPVRSWRRSGMRAFPVPWRPALLRRQLTPVVRRGFDRSATSLSFGSRLTHSGPWQGFALMPSAA